jgi:hypothetical protein
MTGVGDQMKRGQRDRAPELRCHSHGVIRRGMARGISAINSRAMAIEDSGRSGKWTCSWTAEEQR